MKRAQELQSRMSDMQAALEQLRTTGTAGGGMVTVEVSGKLQLLSVKIEPTLLTSGDAEMVEDLVLAATNQALDKARAAAAEQMSQVTGGLELPCMQDMLSKFGIGNSGTE
jgi:DNA-binding YbaB/EbfC family protein